MLTTERQGSSQGPFSDRSAYSCLIRFLLLPSSIGRPPSLSHATASSSSNIRFFASISITRPSQYPVTAKSGIARTNLYSADSFLLWQLSIRPKRIRSPLIGSTLSNQDITEGRNCIFNLMKGSMSRSGWLCRIFQIAAHCLFRYVFVVSNL